MNQTALTFSAIVPTLGRRDTLHATLDSLLKCAPPPDEILVVDAGPGGSAAKTVATLTEGPSRIRRIEAPAGLTRQRNHGLAAARGVIVVFLDDDTVVEPQVFTQLDEVYADKGVVGATGRVIEDHGRRVGGMHSKLRRLLPGGGREGGFTRYGYPRRLLNTERATDVEFMYGCFMSARTDIARAVSFDERLTGYAIAEDEDFSRRLSRLGRIAYRPDIVVRHHNLGFKTTDRRDFSRQVVVNRRYLFEKNFPQTFFARMQFRFLILVLFLHRLANLDLAGAIGIVDAVRKKGLE